MGELVQQAARDFTPSENEEEIIALLGRVNASIKEANDTLDDALSFVVEPHKNITAITKGKR
ncbi:hypothetical protein [Mycetohabitans sp. B46]|uniref:hypothetical protein n=1 Tax=Mycetohabitans sp. B46 TaxID=2772536 RepID=UPI00307E01A6